MHILKFLINIKRAFERFGLFIASIFNFIFLLPVYFIGVGITSIFVRFSEKDVLFLKKIEEKSYWKEYNLKTQKKEDYERMF
jgi:hypothetical protein